MLTSRKSWLSIHTMSSSFNHFKIVYPARLNKLTIGSIFTHLWISTNMTHQTWLKYTSDPFDKQNGNLAMSEK